MILRGVLAPAGASLVLLVILARPWRKNALSARAWAAAPAVVLGLAVGFWALFGLPKLPPAQGWEWVFHAAVLAAFAGILEGLLKRPAWLPYVWRVGLSVLTTWLLAPRFDDFASTRMYWLAGMAMLCVALWATVALAETRVHPVCAVIVIMVAAISGSLILALYGNQAKFGQVAGALTAALGGGWVVAIWNGRAVSLRALAPVVALVLSPLMFNGNFYTYSETPALAFILPATAPLVLVLCLSPIRKLGGVKAALVYLGAAAIPAGSAILLAALSGAGDSYY